MRSKTAIRLFFMLSAVSWMAWVLFDVQVLLSSLRDISMGISPWMPKLIFNVYILFLYYYYRFKVGKGEIQHFVDLLWRVFATGLVATVISLALRLLGFALGVTALNSNVIYIDFIYLINLGLMTAFIIMAFTAWKRLILYQKSKWIVRLWMVFEYGLLLSLVLDVANLSASPNLFTAVLVALIIMGLVLSVNMRWVAFLSFKQKWTGLLLLLLTIFYFFYGLFTLSAGAEDISVAEVLFTDFRSHIFLISVLSFATLYSIFSFLVILFNLPTTSAFEQKLGESINFQRISQSIQTEQSEESVYKILLESSVEAVAADSAWLELTGTDTERRLFTYKISEGEAKGIIQGLSLEKGKGVLDLGSERPRNISQILSSLGFRFRSILSFPIQVKGKNIGALVLLSELPDSFNGEMRKVVGTFANQAGISIENFRLMEEAIQSERYKEELKIAKKVQKSLLPAVLECNPDYDIAAFSESADEVGGDYYDTIRINGKIVSLIIADVSGKGTSAAFHMSQMKGVFHSLSQDGLEPDAFMVRANNALARCLERGSFISASYFLIDSENRNIRFARAGHCPILYYSSTKGTVEFLKGKGIALGMLRDNQFAGYIESNHLSYQPGDIMVLYTDGITEARNHKKEQFGHDRLAEALSRLATLSPREIQEGLIARLYEFSGTNNIDDDYTTMIIRFKEPLG